jgi:hypothetical protein
VYWTPNIITNVDPSELSANGWTECFNATYDVYLLANVVATALSQCNQAKLLMACKQVSDTNYTLAAMGLRSDVLYNCSTSSTCVNVAGGVGWYFSDIYSWGFVNGSDSVDRSSCDVGTTNPSLRLCWHTGGSYGGYRCGATLALNSNSAWQRSIWQAN